MNAKNLLARARKLMVDHDLSAAPQAFELLIQSNKLGSVEAGYALGTWYLHGFYVKQDLKKAIRFLKLAAKEDFCKAILDLAVCFERGVGVERDERKALTLFMRAFALGDAEAGEEVERLMYWGSDAVRDRPLSKAFGALMDRVVARKWRKNG